MKKLLLFLIFSSGIILNLVGQDVIKFTWKGGSFDLTTTGLNSACDIDWCDGSAIESNTVLLDGYETHEKQYADNNEHTVTISVRKGLCNTTATMHLHWKASVPDPIKWVQL